jgi:hypothetical protein
VVRLGLQQGPCEGKIFYFLLTNVTGQGFWLRLDETCKFLRVGQESAQASVASAPRAGDGTPDSVLTSKLGTCTITCKPLRRGNRAQDGKTVCAVISRCKVQDSRTLAPGTADYVRSCARGSEACLSCLCSAC